MGLYGLNPKKIQIHAPNQPTGNFGLVPFFSLKFPFLLVGFLFSAFFIQAVRVLEGILQTKTFPNRNAILLLSHWHLDWHWHRALVLVESCLQYLS